MMDKFNNHPLYRQHNIDSAMSSLWDFYRTRFLKLFIISLAMSLIIQYASSFIDIQELSSVTDPSAMLEKIKGLIVPILIVFVINLFFNLVLQYYVIYNPIDNSNNILVSLSRSLRYFIPYLVTMVFLAFAALVAIVLGVVLLVVGVIFAALYIMTLYMFVLPVMLTEGPDIGNTIKRTVVLAHRNFWSNIGWVAVFIIILIVLSVILSGIILLPFTGSFLKTITNPGDAQGVANMSANPLFIILSAMAGALTMPLLPVFSCILYFNGKAREEVPIMLDSLDNDDRPVKVEDLYAKPYADDDREDAKNE
jgi:hypothetical protein